MHIKGLENLQRKTERNCFELEKSIKSNFRSITLIRMGSKMFAFFIILAICASVSTISTRADKEYQPKENERAKKECVCIYYAVCDGPIDNTYEWFSKLIIVKVLWNFYLGLQVFYFYPIIHFYWDFQQAMSWELHERLLH